MTKKFTAHQLQKVKAILEKYQGSFLGYGKQVTCTVPMGSEDQFIVDMEQAGFFLADDEAGILGFSTDAHDKKILEQKRTNDLRIEENEAAANPRIDRYVKHSGLFKPFLISFGLFLAMKTLSPEPFANSKLVTLVILSFIIVFFGFEFIEIKDKKICLINWKTKFMMRTFHLREIEKIYFTDETDDSNDKVSCTVEFLTNNRKFGFGISLKDKSLVRRLVKKV